MLNALDDRRSSGDKNDAQDESVDDSEEDAVQGKKGLSNTASVAKQIAVAAATIRDSPDEFEESAGLFQMAAIGTKYIDNLIEKEKVININAPSPIT